MNCLVKTDKEIVTERNKFNSPKLLGVRQVVHFFCIWALLQAWSMESQEKEKDERNTRKTV